MLVPCRVAWSKRKSYNRERGWKGGGGLVAKRQPTDALVEAHDAALGQDLAEDRHATAVLAGWCGLEPRFEHIGRNSHNPCAPADPVSGPECPRTRAG